MREQVCQWLLEWFSDRRKTSREAKNEILNINYFDAGLLTSLEVIEFVTEIEEKFAVRFSEADFQDSRFVTMSGLSDLILERAAQTRNCR